MFPLSICARSRIQLKLLISFTHCKQEQLCLELRGLARAVRAAASVIKTVEMCMVVKFVLVAIVSRSNVLDE